MVAAETIVGADGSRSEALPHDRLKAVMRDTIGLTLRLS